MQAYKLTSMKEESKCIVKNVVKIFRCVKLVEGDAAQGQVAHVHDVTIQA